MVQTQDLPDSGFKPIRFTLPYMPRPKLESKSRAIPLKNRKTGQPIIKNGKPVYTSIQYKNPEQAKYEKELMALITLFAPPIPFDCPIVLTLRIFVPMPNSIYDTWKKVPAELGFIRPAGKPDLSNYTKGIEDMMTRAGYWRDDGQIVEYGHGYSKHYSAKPRCEIEVIPLWWPKSQKEWKEFQKSRARQQIIITEIGHTSPDGEIIIDEIPTNQGELF